MKKFAFCFLIALQFCGFIAKAQYLKDPEGKEYMRKAYTEVEGTPFITSNWSTGIVTLVSGQVATAMLKYDLIGDELLFRSKKDTAALTFVDPVRSFSLNDVSIEQTDITPLVFSNGFPAIDKQTATSYYQVIAGGKAQLLKHYRKVVRVDKAFNSATATQTFFLSNVYYLFVNNQITKINPGQKAILAGLSDKADQLQKYIKSNPVNFKSDVALAKLFNYYNSL